MLDKETLQSDILDFLRWEGVFTLATCGADGKPRASTLLFSVNDDFTMSFATHVDSSKVKNLRENSRVGISVGEHPPMNIQATGMVSEVVDIEERRVIFDKLANSASVRKDIWPPIFRVPGEYVVFRIALDWLRVLDLKEAHINEVEPPYHEIVFWLQKI